VNRRLRAIARFIFCLLIAVTVACGDDAPPPGQPGGGGGTPAPPASRLGWSQAASSPEAVQRYAFILFVDGARSALAGSTCSGSAAPTDFLCSGPLPALSPGRHVLEISALDQGTGLEGPKSGQLAIDVGTDGRPRTLESGDLESGPVDVGSALPLPSTTCATRLPATCFTVAAIATDIAPVRRLLPLPDGRVLALQQEGIVTMLPSGTSERPDLGSRGAGVVEVADVAADPDFHANRFLYFATTARAQDGQRTVSVVRVRELADRVGEPATIVADLTAASSGDPAISVGPDRYIYLAMPGPMDNRVGYGGHILRFARDGRAAGYGGVGSPILAQGRAQPARLVWDAAARLLIASAELAPRPVLSVIPADAGSVGWPMAPIAVDGTVAGMPNARLRDMAAVPAGVPATVATLAMIGGEPGILVLATITVATPPKMASIRAIPLGSLTPAAVAFAGNGDLLVAGRRGGEPGAGVTLLRLRATSPNRLP
jgi:hypothetical protein